MTTPTGGVEAALFVLALHVAAGLAGPRFDVACLGEILRTRPIASA